MPWGGKLSAHRSHPYPGHTHTPVHSADCGGELGLQPEHKGFHQPVDAGFFGGLGTSIWGATGVAPVQRGKAGSRPGQGATWNRDHGFLHAVSP